MTLPPLDHVAVLSDDVGIIQHAFESVPNRSTGYCTDDVARGLIVTLARLRLVPNDAHARRLAGVYLAFLHDAQLADGRFHNFMSYERGWLDAVGTHDSCGRAMWALGYGARFAPEPSWRRVCRALLDRALGCVEWLAYERAEAYAMLGLAHAALADAAPGHRAALRLLAERSCARFEATAAESWGWCEETMTYDNARLPEALLRAAAALGDASFERVGLAALAFLESVVFEDGIFVPIGNDGWYRRGGERARFGQQPLEAAAMVDAELAAHALGGEIARLEAAETAFGWYRGKNVLGLALAQGGGCFDGLERDGLNRNMGAESTLAHLAAAYAMADVRRSALRVAR